MTEPMTNGSGQWADRSRQAVKGRPLNQAGVHFYVGRQCEQYPVEN